MSLPQEVRAKYISIIDAILADSDLSRITGKKIREGIQAKIEYDITPQKAAIKDLIHERFDIFFVQQREAEDQTDKANNAAAPTNGHHTPPTKPQPRHVTPAKREAPDDAGLQSPASEVRKKKVKATELDADAAFAAKLQAEEDKQARSTRGGNSRKAAPVKKKSPKKKTAVRVRGSDESEAAESPGENKAKNNGFNKPLNLSTPLSELLDGEVALSRPQCVKRIWQHIRENNLQDPGDKRQIICDEPMRKVFRQEKIHMFTMNKILNHNLYPIED